MEYFFLIFYSLEMILKIMAMGFVMLPHTYLRDAWNVLDFVVVLMSWVTVFAGDSNISVIRALRILRTLRTISSVPSMSSLVTSLINLLPAMGDILVLFFFTVLMFATVAMQLFGGALAYKCVQMDTRNDLDFSAEIYLTDNYGYGGDAICGEESAVICPEDFECLKRTNP
jgi:hypothetical protein